MLAPNCKLHDKTFDKEETIKSTIGTRISVSIMAGQNRVIVSDRKTNFFNNSLSYGGAYCTATKANKREKGK